MEVGEREEREREGEKRKGTDRWVNEGSQEFMGSHLIIFALKRSAAKIFASDVRR
jgi:hypothetical protein